MAYCDTAKINKTRIIFNQKYKNIVSDARVIHKISYQKLIDENTAASLREYLDMNYDNIDICAYGKFTKPDYYAFTISLCFDQSILEKYDNWEDLSKTEIQNVSTLSRPHDSQCCCGQHITEVYTFNGGYTSAIVGNVCMEKSNITNISVLEKLSKIRKEKSLDKKRKRLTEEDKTQVWYKNERRCLGTNDRICNRRISRKEPYWKSRCIHCHKNTKKTQEKTQETKKAETNCDIDGDKNSSSNFWKDMWDSFDIQEQPHNVPIGTRQQCYWTDGMRIHRVKQSDGSWKYN